MDHLRAIQQSYNSFLSQFPLKKYPVHYKAEEFSVPKLFIYGPSHWNQKASFDVKCLQWQTYLNMRNVEYDVYYSNEGNASSNDKLPFLALPDGRYLTGEEIREYADKIEQYSKDENKPADKADDDTTEQNPDEQALLSLIERKLYPALLYWLWCEQENYRSLTRLHYGTVPWTMQRNVSNWIYTRYRGDLSYDRIYADAAETLLALDNQLGKETWMLHQSKPSFLDAACFAYLHAILSTTTVPQAKLRSLVRQHENLVAYEQRIFAEQFPNDSELAKDH
ncbi:hypothetical protein BDF19DRAFT_431740 [Syncephalis fuscata]|nr:hypothetical protein BDF19DRAFT_431740 [Syncephalis fuscata]